MVEHWKPIPDFLGYEVSDIGNVRSYWKNNHTLAATPHLMYPRPAYRGRMGVTLQKDRKPYTRSVHRLVLLAFVGPCPKGQEGCHNDSQPLNNRLDNLRWDTRESNWQDRRDNGFDGRGSQNGRARLSSSQVIDIRYRFSFGESYDQLAHSFGIGKTTIAHIVNGRTWQDVGGPISHAGKRRNLTKIRAAHGLAPDH